MKKNFTQKREVDFNFKRSVIKYLLLLLVMLSVNYSFSQWNTATINNTIETNEYGTNNNNNYLSGTPRWYMTWDDTYLYLSIQSANEGEAGIVYFDTDPTVPVNGTSGTNGSTTGIAYDGLGATNLPFTANSVIYFKNNYRELRRWNGSSWITIGSGDGGLSGTGNDYTDNSYSSNSAGRRELRISWSRLTGGGSGSRPASFNWVGDIAYSNGRYGQVPINNPTGSYGANTVLTDNYYFTVSNTGNTTSTNPISRTSYTQPQSDVAGYGAQSVWDFTANSSGKFISRDTSTGGDWTISGTLVVGNGSVFFGNGSTYGNSNIANVDVRGGALDMDFTTKPLNVSGNISITGGTLRMSNSSGADMKLAGDLTVNGGTLDGSGTRSRAIFFTKSSGTQIITGSGSGSITIPYLVFDSNGSNNRTVQLVNTDLALTAPGGGNPISFGSSTNDILDLNSKNLVLGTAGKTSSISGIGSFKGNINSSLTIVGGDTSASSGTIKMISDFNLSNLTINNTSTPTSNYSLGSALIVNGIATLTNGTITTFTNILNVSNSATAAVVRTNGYVIGNLQRSVATGTNIYAYAVGTSSGYTPASIAFAGTTGSGNVTVASTNGASVNYPSGLSATKRVARYWSVTNSGVSGFTAAATFTYLGADLVGGATQSSVKPFKFDTPSTFSYPTSSTGTLSFTETGLTSFSEFGAGECTTPSAPTGALTIVNSTCASSCTVSGGSISLGGVTNPNGSGTLEYSLNGGTSWSSTLPIYAAPQTIIASVINASGCRSLSTSVGSTVAGTCTTPSAPTGSLDITNSTCASVCTVSGGSISLGGVTNPNGSGTLEYSLNGGTSWSSTLPTYAAPQTIIASVINASGCRSLSTSVGSTVAGTCTTPNAPTGSLDITNSTCASVCTVSGGSISLGSVTNPNGSGTLEYSLNGGTSWSSTLPTYAAPQTIIASVINAGGCRSLTTSVGSTVAGTCTTPSAPTGSLDITNSTCASACTVSGGSISLGSVTNPNGSGTLEYSLNGGTSWSSTLPTYAAPQTIIASVINAGGCRSLTTSVGSTVAGTCTTPSAPTGSLDITNSTCASACTVSGGSISLGSVTNPNGSGTLEYSLNGGTSWSSTLPSYAAPQTILASVINASGCRSTSFQVGTTVAGTCAPVTAGITNNTGSTVLSCAQTSISVTATGGVSYSWSGGATLNTAGNSFTTAGTYTVTVTGSNGCTNTAQIVITGVVSSPPNWYLDADNDGYSSDSALPVTQCTRPVGAYKLSSELTGVGTDCRDNIAGINPGASEIFFDNVDQNCNNSTFDGHAPVVVNITTASGNLALMTTPINCSVATNTAGNFGNSTGVKYRFQVSKTSGIPSVAYVTSSTTSFAISSASNAAHSSTYDVTATAVVYILPNGQEEEQPYAGNTRTFVTPMAPTIPLTTQTGAPNAPCAYTLAKIDSYIYANNSTTYGANRFEFTVERVGASPAEIVIVPTTGPYFRLTAISGIPASIQVLYGATYKVKVRYGYDSYGSAVWSNYGSDCLVTTPALAVPAVTCGPLASINAYLYASGATPGANLYEFKVTRVSAPAQGELAISPPGNTEEVVPRTVNNFKLSMLTTLFLGLQKEYNVSVRYRINSYGTQQFSGWSAVNCPVYTPDFPATMLIDEQCDQPGVPSTLTQYIYSYNAPGATSYRFRLTKVGTTLSPQTYDYTVESPDRYVKLIEFPGLTAGFRYSISVVAVLYGETASWISVKECSLIAPASTPVGPTKDVVLTKFQATAYPNPFATNFLIDVKTSSQSIVNLKVYDMIGRLIEQRDVQASEISSTTIGDRYPSGVYNVVVSQQDNIETVRVVKR